MAMPSPRADALSAFDPGFHHVLAWMPGVAYVETVGTVGMTSYVSPRIQALTGYPPERFTNSWEFWYSIVHPDDLPDLEAADALSDTSFEPYLQEYRMRTADGSLLWVRDEAIYVPADHDQPSHWIGLLVDITEQKRLESDLRSEAEKFRSLADQIPAVVYIEGAGGSNDSPVYISPKYEELLGYTPEERRARPTLW